MSSCLVFVTPPLAPPPVPLLQPGQLRQLQQPVLYGLMVSSLNRAGQDIPCKVPIKTGNKGEKFKKHDFSESP